MNLTLLTAILLLTLFALFIVHLLLRDMDRMQETQRKHAQDIASLNTEVQLLKQANQKRINRKGLEHTENAQTALALAKKFNAEVADMLNNATAHLEEVHNPKP